MDVALADFSQLDDLQRAVLMELAGRELCERHLYDFVRGAFHVVCPGEEFIEGWHLEAVCLHLEAVADGRIQEIIINVPPGTMKSLLVGVFWPAWCWIKRRHMKFMFASYAADLSQRDSTRCRQLVESQWYQSRWPLRLSDDQNTKGKWDNAEGGWRMATSVGGKGTGEHPDVKIADDPHNTMQAQSDAERRSAVDWWDSTMTMRGALRNSRSVVVMQRLHQNDLSGHLLASDTGWTHLCLPMRYEPPTPDPETKEPVPRMRTTPIGWQDPRTEPGELLWPAGYGEEKVARLEAKLGSNAPGQLQQRPTPKGGGEFKREWFKVAEVRPPGITKWVRYWDKAATTGGKGAESASVLMGKYSVDHPVEEMRDRYLIADAFTFRKGWADREAVMKQTAASDKATYGHVETWVEQEPGSGGKESAEATVMRNPGHTFKIERVTGSKEVRAAPLASQASVGKVSILAGSWNRQLLDELESFPLGALKDLVDGCSGAFNKLFTPGTGIRPGDLRGGGQASQMVDRSSRDDEDRVTLSREDLTI